MTIEEVNQGYTARLYADVGALLARGPVPPPHPTIGVRSDNVGLFYKRQVNSLIGDPESGKTFLAMAASADVMFTGGSVLFVDLDHNGVDAIVSRYRAMGIKGETLADASKFRYAEPDDATDIAGIVNDAKGWRPDFVLIDSMGELMPVFGANSNNPDDFTRVHSAAIKPFATMGACVVVIDHLAKGAQSRTYGASGTTAKKRAIGGTLLRVSVEDSFTPGHGGRSEIVLVKDRNGGLRARCPIGREPLAARFRMVDREGALTWYIDPPEPGEQPRTSVNSVLVSGDVMEELKKLDPPPVSVRDIKQRCKWGTDKASEAWRVWQEVAA